MALTIRKALQSDKKRIISFCTSTFSWGDYIPRVWDIWYKERNGRLFVAESHFDPIGMAHASLCPRKQGVWLEGLRVHPDFRRLGVASELLDSMLAYGERNGAPEALAVVSTGNKPSRLMLEKHGFIIITEWSYSSISKPIKLKKKKSAATHLANLDELEKICCYLANSSIFQESAKSYVNSWRWYLLDRHTVRSFISRSSLVVTGDPIEGVALLNADGYWNRRDVIQIVYLDSMLEDSINDLLSFVARIYSERGFSHLHIFCHARLAYNKLIGFEIEESERFLVYRKNLLLPSK